MQRRVALKMAESAKFYNKRRAKECCNIKHVTCISSATLDTTLTLTRLYVEETTQFANVVFVCDSCSSDWFILHKHNLCDQ
jgi:hypothetical protein